MSGVRNLRAMFEQKGDGSMPDRGRSPPGGFGTPSPSASPRPLSKVRTAFVAVEKDGRIGLRREPSGDSVSASSRRLSNDTDTTTPQLVPERSEIFSDNLATNIISKMNLSHDPIPESPRQDTPVKLSPKKELKGPLLQPNPNSDKVAHEGPRAEMPASSPVEPTKALNGTSSAPAAATIPNGKPTSKTAAAAAAAAASTTKAASRGRKTPPTSKAPSAKEPTKAASSPANAKKVIATKAAAPKPAPTDPTQSAAGFVRPKPKSPTRPVKLPPSLTTHTASSAQKLGGGNAAPPTRRSVSRASGSVQHLSPTRALHRSPSRHSIATTGATTKALNRKPSSLNVSRPRPSVGPPPKPAVSDQPVKKETHVDESFLARMTRPTESSAKRTSSKAPVSPTRKQHVPVKRPEAKDAVEKNVKKVAAKVQPPSAKAKTTNSAKPAAAKDQLKAKVITAATKAAAKTTEPTTKRLTKPSDAADAGSVKDDKTNVTADSSKDAAAIATQEESAENVDTAKSPTEASQIAEAEPAVDAEADATGSKDTEEPESAASTPVSGSLEDVPEANETVSISTGDVQPPVDEPVKPDVSVPNPEAKTEGAEPVAAAPDVASEGHAVEETNREASAAAQ